MPNSSLPEYKPLELKSIRIVRSVKSGLTLGLFLLCIQVWSLQDNARVFLESVRLFLDKRASEIGGLHFDKDDTLAVEFVTAASNLRDISFGIQTQVGALSSSFFPVLQTASVPALRLQGLVSDPGSLQLKLIATGSSVEKTRTLDPILSELRPFDKTSRVLVSG